MRGAAAGRFGRKCRSGGCAGPGGMAGTDEADYTQRLQLGEVEVVEHFAPGLRGVEFPPDGHEIRNGVLPPFGQAQDGRR